MVSTIFVKNRAKFIQLTRRIKEPVFYDGRSVVLGILAACQPAQGATFAVGIRIDRVSLGQLAKVCAILKLFEYILSVGQGIDGHCTRQYLVCG